MVGMHARRGMGHEVRSLRSVVKSRERAVLEVSTDDGGGEVVVVAQVRDVVAVLSSRPEDRSADLADRISIVGERY